VRGATSWLFRWIWAM